MCFSFLSFFVISVNSGTTNNDYIGLSDILHCSLFSLNLIDIIKISKRCPGVEFESFEF